MNENNHIFVRFCDTIKQEMRLTEYNSDGVAKWVTVTAQNFTILA